MSHPHTLSPFGQASFLNYTSSIQLRAVTLSDQTYAEWKGQFSLWSSVSKTTSVRIIIDWPGCDDSCPRLNLFRITLLQFMTELHVTEQWNHALSQPYDGACCLVWPIRKLYVFKTTVCDTEILLQGHSTPSPTMPTRWKECCIAGILLASGELRYIPPHAFQSFVSVLYNQGGNHPALPLTVLSCACSSCTTYLSTVGTAILRWLGSQRCFGMSLYMTCKIYQHHRTDEHLCCHWWDLAACHSFQKPHELGLASCFYNIWISQLIEQLIFKKVVVFMTGANVNWSTRWSTQGRVSQSRSIQQQVKTWSL